MPPLNDLFKRQPRTFSFELFPPKTPEGHTKLLNTISALNELKPDFFSCTYGAGGGSRGKTLDIVEHIEKQHGTAAVAHLTCVLHTKNEINGILEDMRRRGITNVLALRGDPPLDNLGWQPGPENFQYSCELVNFIRTNFGASFGIGVAGFPEGHALAPTLDFDASIMNKKIAAGADFVITQLFFDNRWYFDYTERLKKLGITARVIPGILPITDYAALQRFCTLCKASIPPAVREIFEPIAADPEKTLQAGIDFAVRQGRELLDRGAPGLHFYTLNKLKPTDTIVRQLRG